MTTLSLLAAFAVACNAQSAPSYLQPSASVAAQSLTPRGVEIVWASYQIDLEPHYRLLFEGATDGRRIEAIRILDVTGTEIAMATTTDTSSETLKMCGKTKSDSTTTYGPSRATLAVAPDLFKGFLSEARPYRVEARIQGVWIEPQLTFACSATQ